MSDGVTYQRSYDDIAKREVRLIKGSFEPDNINHKNIEDEKSFVSSCPQKWFKFDTWKVGYALPILSGIDPVKPEIVWESPLEFYTPEDFISGRVRTCVRLISCELIGMCGLFGNDVSLDPYLYFGFPTAGRSAIKFEAEKIYGQLDNLDKNAVSNILRNTENDENLSEVARKYLEASIWKRAYDWAEVRLNNLYDMWVSRIDAEPEFNLNTRYPKQYFFDWIKHKNLQELVPWWFDAIRNGLVEAEQKDILLLSRNEKKHDFPDCLDSNHEHFSLKLKAAIDVWEAVAKEPVLKISPKKAITEWLRKNAANYGLVKGDGTLNETGIEEIAKVAHWRPKGGAIKTPQ